MTYLVERPRWGADGRDLKAESIWRTLRAFGAPVVQADLWLDVGCGSGGVAEALAARGTFVVGVDPEPWPEWRVARDEYPNLDFVVGRFDSAELAIQDSTVDIVVCNQVYEHVNDPQQLIVNLFRVLRPGGIVYFAGPNLLWPIEPHVFWPLVHWLPRRFALKLMRALGSERMGDLDANSAHRWRLEAWFKRAGFAYRNALRVRASEDARSGLPGKLLRGLSRHAPEFLWTLLLPVAPGFVYLLIRPDGVE